jgi:hypothetical protein
MSDAGRYAIAVAVGLAAALLAALTTVVVVGLTLAAIVASQSRTTGSGGIGAISAGPPLLLVPAAAFVLGFAWYLRRTSHGR